MVAAPARSIFLLTVFASASLAQTSGQLQFREIGPVVGGRIDDFAVVESDPDVMYIRTASGGVWETSDGAITWKPIFEQVGATSIGAVLVAPGDYIVKIQGKDVATKTVHVLDDPAIAISEGDYGAPEAAISRAYDLYRVRTAVTATLNFWKSSSAAPVPQALRTDAEAFSKKIDELAPLLTGGGNPLTMPQTFRQPPIPERVAHLLFTFENYTAAPRARDMEHLDQLAAAEQDALARLDKSFADSGVACIALPAHSAGRN
jgi:hypothetical protein